MKISKKDARLWFEFFAQLPEDMDLMPRQNEIALAAFAQMEADDEEKLFPADFLHQIICHRLKSIIKCTQKSK